MSDRRLPRYQELKNGIVQQIARGALGPGDRVPSENELVESEGVSRMTANRALRELTAEGYLERVTGSGTFVADFKATSHPLEVRDIAEEVASRGHSHSAEVLIQERSAAAARLLDSLDLEPGAPVFHTRIVHCENARPIQLEDRYVVEDFAPDFLAQDFRAQTPSAYLSAISPLQDAEHVVRAERPPPRVRRALGMAVDEPCLVISRRTWSDGRPVTFARLFHPGSRFELAGRYAPKDGNYGNVGYRGARGRQAERGQLA